MRNAALHIAAQRDDYAPSFASRFAAVVRFLRDWNRARRALARLDRLDDHMLADIGLTRADLEAETRLGTLAGADSRLAALARRRQEDRWR